MSIYVQRIDGGNLRVLAGQRRLRAALSAFGYANVTDSATDEQFRVQEVDGQIVALVDPHPVAAETMAATAIERAAR